MLVSVHTFLQDHGLVVSAAQTAEDIMRCRYGVHREGRVKQPPSGARYMSEEGPYLALEVVTGAGRFWQRYFPNFNTPNDQTFLQHLIRVQLCLDGLNAHTWRLANTVYF